MPKNNPKNWCNCGTPKNGIHGGRAWTYSQKGESDRYFCTRCKNYMGKYPKLYGWFELTKKGLTLGEICYNYENGLPITEKQKILLIEHGLL